MTAILCGYILTVTLFLIVPGPVGLLVIRAAAARDWHGAPAAIIGSNTASLVLIAAAGLMLAGIAGISAKLFSLLALCGGFYLIYYAYTLWQHGNGGTDAETPLLKLHHLTRQAFLVGISNPKDVIFFLTFFPPFIEKLGLGLGKSALNKWLGKWLSPRSLLYLTQIFQPRTP